MSKDIEEVKAFLTKKFPKYKGFIKHTLAARMAKHYALKALEQQQAEIEQLKTERHSQELFIFKLQHKISNGKTEIEQLKKDKELLK